MNPTDSTLVLDQLIESFIDRQRRGERPSVDEYVARHPDLADEIREVLPALVLMEDLAAPGPATGSFPAARLSSAAIPASLGEFAILREVGRGGMGIVYEALQETLGRHVALKVLPPQMQSNAVYLERFRREAQAAARLHHTNIVPVFAVGEHDGVAYYAMQFIRGQTLEAVLQELRRFRAVHGAPNLSAETAGPLSGAAQSLLTDRFQPHLASTDRAEEGEKTPISAARPESASASAPEHSALLSSAVGKTRYWRNVAELGVQIAEALAYAHGQGLIHRDIKPSNLMLDASGVVWVTDFGLAKLTGGSDLTNPGDVLGTLRYMAPEQLSGHADTRSDIYALGATLYELATLQPAFGQADRLRLMDDLRHAEPARPRKLEPMLPRDLETIILKAMAKEPERRYPTAEALAEDLRRFLADRPVQARRSGWVEHGWRWCRRNRWVASLLGFIALLLCGVTLGSVLAAVFFRDLQVETQAARDEARQRLWKSLLSEAEARSLSRRPGQRFDSLKMIREALTLVDRDHWTEADRLRFRNGILACLALPDIETARIEEIVIGAAHSWNFGYDIDAKLERYVRGDEEGAVSVQRVRDDAVLLRLPARGHRVHVHLSANGQRLAVSDAAGWQRKLEIWDLADPPKLLHEFSGNTGAYVAFTPEGDKAAYYVLGQCIRAIDLKHGTMRKFDTSQTDYWRPLAFSPDGKTLTRVVVVVRDWQVQLLDTTDLTLPTDLKYRGTLITRSRPDSVAWHPNGLMLATGCDDKRIYLFDVASRRAVQVLEGQPARGIALAFDPTGRLLVSTDWSNQLRLWDTATGRQQQQIPGRGRLVRFGDDGRLATQGETPDGRLRILRIAPGEETRAVADLVTRAGGLLAHDLVRFSTTDRLFVASVNTRLGDQLGGFALIDPVGGTALAASDDLDAMPVAFLADGSLITQGRDAVRRWPRTRTEAQVRFGPPEEMTPLKLGVDPLAVDAAGRVLVAPLGQSRFWIRRPGLEDTEFRSSLGDARHAAVSPDGKWIALGNHEEVSSDGINAHVYETATLRRVAALKVDGQCRVGFSPDGRWLWTSGAKCRLFEVGSWTPGPVLNGSVVAFAPDGVSVAIGGNHGSVRLVHLQSGAELAMLQHSDTQRMFPRGFSADGAHLFVFAEDSRVGLIWNLRLMRQQLADFDLDWDAPPIRPASNDAQRPKTVQIVFGPARENLAAERYLAEGNYLQALAELRKSLAIDPKQPEILSRLANILTKGPTGLRDHAEAIRVIDRTIQLDPSWRAIFRRAEAHFAAGDYEKALTDFDRVVEMNGRSSDVYIARAECLDRLNRREEAFRDLERALAHRTPGIYAYNLRARWQMEAGRGVEAVADWRQSLKIQPKQPKIALDLARELLFGPMKLRQPREAKYWVDRVAELYPEPAKNPARAGTTFLGGVALYQLGEFAQAIQTLDNSAMLRHPRMGGTAQLFVALSHHRLGAKDDARNHYQSAIAWQAKSKLTPLEVREYEMAYREAAKLLDGK